MRASGGGGGPASARVRCRWGRANKLRLGHNSYQFRKAKPRQEKTLDAAGTCAECVVCRGPTHPVQGGLPYVYAGSAPLATVAFGGHHPRAAPAVPSTAGATLYLLRPTLPQSHPDHGSAEPAPRPRSLHLPLPVQYRHHRDLLRRADGGGVLRGDALAGRRGLPPVRGHGRCADEERGRHRPQRPASCGAATAARSNSR